MSPTYNNAVGPHVRASQSATHQCRDSGDRLDHGRCAARHPSGQRDANIIDFTTRGTIVQDVVDDEEYDDGVE